MRKGLPHLLPRPTYTAQSGIRHPFVRLRWILCGLTSSPPSCWWCGRPTASTAGHAGLSRHATPDGTPSTCAASSHGRSLAGHRSDCRARCTAASSWWSRRLLTYPGAQHTPLLRARPTADAVVVGVVRESQRVIQARSTDRALQAQFLRDTGAAAFVGEPPVPADLCAQGVLAPVLGVGHDACFPECESFASRTFHCSVCAEHSSSFGPIGCALRCLA